MESPVTTRIQLNMCAYNVSTKDGYRFICDVQYANRAESLPRLSAVCLTRRAASHERSGISDQGLPASFYCCSYSIIVSPLQSLTTIVVESSDFGSQLREEEIMSTSTTARKGTGTWSQEEHARFLQALQTHPHGPWRIIADHVGTRSARQVQTHAQRYYEKVARHLRGLQMDRRNVLRTEHRIDQEIMGICEQIQRAGDLESAMSPRYIMRMMQATSLFSQATFEVIDMEYDDTELEERKASPPTIRSGHALPSYDECIDFLIQALDTGDVEQ